MLTRIIIALALIASTGGIGYGLWQGRIASARASDIAQLQAILLKKETALRGAQARAKASASAAKARKKINQEQEIARAKDQDAVSRNPEWASQPIPADIAERLLND